MLLFLIFFYFNLNNACNKWNSELLNKIILKNITSIETIRNSLMEYYLWLFHCYSYVEPIYTIYIYINCKAT